MRHTPAKLLLAIAAFLFSTALSAGEVATTYICTHSSHPKLLRRVEISHLALGCEVTYIKSDEAGNETSKVIYTAKHSTDYCDEKGSEFVTEKLVKKYGWLCQAKPTVAEPEGVWTEPVTGMKFVSVPGGSFQIGDPFGEGHESEQNNRQITIKPFRLGAMEVTQAQWKASMNNNPSEFKGDDLPVEQVSFYDVQEFIKKLNARTGGRFRLPTEAEWEYACREGGRKVRFCNGKDIADPSEINFDARAKYKKPYSVVGVYRGATTLVASFAPNSLGLYDMSGNVEEWTCSEYNSRYDGSEEKCSGQARYYSLHGGSWNYGPWLVRSASRLSLEPDNRYTNLGFRLAQD